MKTFIKAILISATCLIAASCLQETSLESEYQKNEPLTITTWKGTKTSLNGSEVHWSSDDIVAIFDNYNVKNRFQAISTNGNNAEFSGEVTSGTTMLFAVYPYNLANSANGSTLNVTIPTEQTSKDGSFAEEHNISIAKAAKTPGVEVVSGISFKNICAYLKFTVPSYLADVKKVTLSSKSIIAGDMTIDYSAETPETTISSEGSKSITMTGQYAAGSTFWFVLAPGTLDGISICIETSKGVYSMSTDNKFEMTAGNYKNLGTLNLAPASITNATAAHTYHNGALTGTEVSVNLGISEATAAYITAMTLHIKNSEGTILRTSNLNSITEKVVMPAEGSWPYLPKGNYTVSGTYTLSGITEKTIKDIEFSITENPVFEVTATTPYTSYDKYLAGDAAGANGLNGSTIYNVGATVSVSDAILNNANYPSLLITDNDTEVAAGNLSGRSWGKHTIKASYTLDGVTVSKESSVDVTGLPYTAAPPMKSGDHPWTDNATSARNSINWNTDGVKLEGISKDQILTSPSFHIPSDINVNMIVPVKFYSVCVMWIHAQPQLLCRIGGVEVDNRHGAKASSGLSKNQSENYTSNKNGTLTTSNNTVEVENNYENASAYIYVYSVDLKYR